MKDKQYSEKHPFLYDGGESDAEAQRKATER